MTTIVTRTSKGAPLTRAELDANFTNLNNDKVETSNVQYTTPGSGAVSVVVNPALNSNLGGFANVIAGGGAAANPQIINHGNYNTISGGYDNQTAPASGGASSSEANTIAGGAHHRMEAGVNHGTIMGGSYGLIKADVAYATIGGGSSHTVTGSTGTVSGGAQNTAGRDATIGGGVVNTASGRYAVVGGGTLNTASAEAATIAGGNNNSAGGGGGSVGGGADNNIAAGLYNTIGGGYQNVLGNTASSSYSTIGGGRANSIQTGQYACIPGGLRNSVTADYGVATGVDAKAYLRGMVAHSSASNNSQLGSLHLYRQTTNATETDLYLDGASAYPILPENSLIGFTIHICAARTDVVGEFAWYVYRGVVKREGANAAVILSSTLVDSYETTAAWNTRLAIVNGAFRIPVTGEAGKTIRWSARMDMIEQRFA